MSDEIDVKTDIYLWSKQDLSQHIIKKIKDRLKNLEEELVSGVLVVSKELEREYCLGIGKIDNTREILKLLETGEWNE